MTTPEPAATRREVDLLRDDVHRLDEHGTRGVQAMQVQLTDLVKDVIELKTEVNSRFDAHQKVHDADVMQRREGRRWMIGTAIGGIVAMAAVVGMLADILAKVH